jgi:hypothetical protein
MMRLRNVPNTAEYCKAGDVEYPSVAGRRCCSASQLGMSPLPRLLGIEGPNNCATEFSGGRRKVADGSEWPPE